jgi:hypothetical protein
MAKGGMDRVKAQRLIRMLSEAGSVAIISTVHASRRKQERQIDTLEIQQCLQNGSIVEGPFQNAKGNWQCTVKRSRAGEELTVAVAIEGEERLVVLTAYR